MSAGDQYFEDLLKIEFTYAGERNTAANILYASCAAAHGATIDDLSGVGNPIFTAWGDNIMPLVHHDITLVNGTISDWTSADGLSYTAVLGTEGGYTGALLPDQVATLCVGEASMRYRGGKQRIYIPAPEQSQLSTGQLWESSFQDDMTAAIIIVINTINDQTIGDQALTAVLYHRAGNKVVEQGFEAIESIGCSAIPATQRRRVRRVGHIA